MIPKIIHYCWISGEESMPEDIKMCLETWKKQLPDYEFINWNDSNFDWGISSFTAMCRESNLYAFCSDYVRFWALYNYGGIYLDSDVLVYKSFNNLLGLRRILTNECVYRCNDYIDAGILGGEKNDMAFKHILSWYDINTGRFSLQHFYICPYICRYMWDKIYTKEIITDLDKYNYDENVLSILSVDKFFEKDIPTSYAYHLFKNSWIPENRREQWNLCR